MDKKKKKLPPGVRERDGRFTYRYSVEVIKNGKLSRKQKETISYPTAKEAYDAGIQIEANRLSGKLIDEKNLTLGQWRDRWLQDYEIEREPREYTVRNRKTALNSLCKCIGEHTRIKDVTGDEYQGWLNQLKRDKKKKGTIQEYHSGAQLFFADAVRKKIIADNPAADVVLPAFKQTLEEIETNGPALPKFLEREQLQHFLGIIRFRGKPQEYNIFMVLAYTGLRIGELLALKTSDFDEDKRTLSITKTLTVLSDVKKYTLGPPKTKSSIRKVTIGDSVIKVIKAQIAWRDKRIADGEALHNNDFIFWNTSYPGFPANRISLALRFSSFLKIAELPVKLTPHSLRHTHVSLLAAAGVQLAVIQERLGHKNGETITTRIYMHVTEDQRKLTPDRFEAIMSV